MDLRRARRRELAACAAMFQRVAAETFTWRDPADMTAASFLRDAAVEEVTVALGDARLLGVVTLYRPHGFIHSLFVEDRGRGVGAALLRRAKADAGGPVSLKVEAANTRAIAFYVREGFLPGERGVDERGPWIRMTSG